MTQDERLIMRAPNSGNTPHKSGKNYLLVIGIDKYADGDVPPLKNAVRDTERLTQILTTKYDFQLLRPLHDAQATRSAVLETIEELENTLTSEDNLVIFFSGHGYRKKDDGFIVPFDGHNNKTTNYISFVDLNRMINALPMHHFLFILDCCFAGSALKNLGEKRELNKPSRRILAASSPDETAEDGFYGRNSPFTSALAEILEDNEGTEFPVKTLHVQLRNLMDTKGVRQVPVEGSWKMDSNRDGEFIFLKKDVEADTWQALDKTNKNALNAFVAKYPNSGFVGEATAFIQEIETKEAKKQQEADAQRKVEAEKQAYERALANPTVKNLNQFLKDYPLSIFSENIEKRLAEAEIEAAWKEAKNQNTISAFRTFKGRFSQNADWVAKANKRIESIEAALEEEEMKRKLKTVEPAPIPKPAILETPKPLIEVPVPKVETPKSVVEKPVGKVIEVPDIQRVETVDEPSFFEKYKMHLVGVGVLIALLMWAVLREKEPVVNTTPTNSTPSVIEPKTPVTRLAFEPETVEIQGGTFKMGSTQNDSEKPIHEVTVSNFSLGKFEVTVEQYMAFCNETKAHYPEWLEKGNNYNVKTGKDAHYKNLGEALQAPNNPIVGISWNDAVAYCEWLSQKTNKKYRLPTEAEWEFAARGGTQSKGYTYSGSNDVKSVAWLSENSSRKTHAVGQKNANELGIHDMSGNVWEWCSDLYGNYNSGSQTNPTGAATGSYRVFRGGGWGSIAEDCRSTIRGNSAPTNRGGNLGFRLAISSLQ